jgi:hypothetical protein
LAIFEENQIHRVIRQHFEKLKGDVPACSYTAKGYEKNGPNDAAGPTWFLIPDPDSNGKYINIEINEGGCHPRYEKLRSKRSSISETSIEHSDGSSKP